MPPNLTLREARRLYEYGCSVAGLLLSTWRVAHETGDADADERAFGEALATWLLQNRIEVFPARPGAGPLVDFTRTGRAAGIYPMMEFDEAVRGVLDEHAVALRRYLAAPCSSPAPLPTSEASDG